MPATIASSSALSDAVQPTMQRDPQRLDDSVLKRCKDATVLIANFEHGTLTAFGSGFACKDGRTIATNKHVVTGTDDEVDACKLVFFSGTDHPRLVQVAASDIKVFDDAKQSDEKYFEHDLALIHIGAVVAEPLSLGSSDDAVETEGAWAFGFPHGMLVRLDGTDLPSPTVHGLRIERVEKKDGVANVLQLGGSPTHGDSGGPVVDQEGNVIGVMQAKDTGAGIVYAVPTGRFKELYAKKDGPANISKELLKPIQPSGRVASVSRHDADPGPSTGRSIALADRLVTDDDLARLSARELTILRNEPFARRGYIFKRADLRAAFGAAAWYQPRTTSASAVSATFTSTEARNVQYVRDYQVRTGKTW